MLRLRHEAFAGSEGEVPEVVLFNRHDRSSAYKLYTGVLRYACENGLVVQSADFGSFSIRHSGSRDLSAHVREATARIMEEVPAIMNRIEAWKGIILPRRTQLDFAREGNLGQTPEEVAAFFITDGIFRRNVTPGGRIQAPKSWKGFKP